jgi:hypothetical protein
MAELKGSSYDNLNVFFPQTIIAANIQTSVVFEQYFVQSNWPSSNPEPTYGCLPEREHFRHRAAVLADLNRN